jgi:hypothetical protein
MMWAFFKNCCDLKDWVKNGLLGSRTRQAHPESSLPSPVPY